MFQWLRPRRAVATIPPPEASPEVQAALTKIQAGDLDGAERILQESLAARPGDVHALMGLANALFARGLHGEALELLHQVLDIDPSFALARVNAVQCLRGLGRYDDAIRHCHELLARDPAGSGVALLAQCLEQLGRAEDAEATYLSAIDLAPGDPALLCAYGGLLFKTGRRAEAEGVLRQALAIDPQGTVALNNLAHLLLENRCIDEAEVLLGRAAGLPDTPPEVWVNFAVLRAAQNRLDESLAFSDRALSAGLKKPEALFVRATTLLLSGRLLEGFSEYEHRFETSIFAGTVRHGPGRLWRGEPLAGHRILLWPEQGLGDTLQFVRYVRVLAALGAEVIVEVQTPLVSLLTESLPATVVMPGTMVEADFHCPLMSLPHRLGGAVIDAPWEGPYLRAPKAGSASTTVAALAHPRVGLVWAGNPSHPNDANRSMPFSALGPLLNVPGVDFVSLQFGTAAAEAASRPVCASWTDLTPLIHDFGDTAAALAELDLLITIDTSIAHLAGALGLPAWVLLPFSPDWRWQLAREDSPWYPSLRLLRQRAPREWASLVDEAANRLASFRGVTLNARRDNRL